MTPEEYVLDKFNDRDVVFLGEFHKFRQNLDLLHRLIPLLHERGVYNLAYEFARREDQPLIDSLLRAPEYDEALAQLIMFRQGVHWPFREYVDVYRIAWELNRGLPEGKHPFRVLGVNASPDWSQITKPEDRDNPEIMRKVWKSTRMEEEWGQLILDSVVSKGEKALVYSGTHHAFSEYRQPKVFEGEFRGWGDTRMGNVVFEAIGKRAITVVLHHPWFGREGYEKPFVFPADGYIDEFFRRHPDLSPAGFDTKGTPFGNLPGETSLYVLGYDRFTLASYCDGYIYLCPISEYQPVGLIEGFVNEENLAQARLHSPDPTFRTASVEDFRAEASTQLDFQKRMPGRPR
jgi:hypothetical protein